MLYNKLALTLFLLILFVPFISAEDNFLFKQGSDFTLDIKVTNNDLSPCTTCNCTFSIFYPDGSEFIKDAVGVNTNGHCKLINSSNVLGIHNGEISLTDGTSYGLSTFAIEITVNGKEKPSEILLVVYTLLFIAIFFFSFYYFFKALEHVIAFEMDLYDTIILMGSYFSVWIFYYFSVEYIGNAFMNNILEIAIQIGAFTHVFLALVGFFVSFIMTNLKFKQQASVTY